MLGATGALPGAAITVGFWLLPGPTVGVVWIVLIAAFAGGAVGATIAIAIGAGLVKEAWDGPLDALLITAAVMPFINVLAFLIFLSIGGGGH